MEPYARIFVQVVVLSKRDLVAPRNSRSCINECYPPNYYELHRVSFDPYSRGTFLLTFGNGV